MTSPKTKPMQAHDHYPLRTAARLTGLSPDIIRAWERRYQVVEPIRGARGARLYTRADIDHLGMLATLVARGRAIGDIARLDPAVLESLAGTQASRTKAAPGVAVSDTIAAVLELVEGFKLRELEIRLGEALIGLGAQRFVEDVARPLLVEVGERWAAGTLTVAEEHLVSTAMRHILSGLIRLRTADSGPGLLLSTPAGELHEIGLMLVGLLAVEVGVRTYLLGPNLPAAEIAGAARRSRAAVVGLSVVNPENEEAAIKELRDLERRLPPDVELWLGGGNAQRIAPLLQGKAITFENAAEIEFHLKRLRGKE